MTIRPRLGRDDVDGACRKHGIEPMLAPPPFPIMGACRTAGIGVGCPPEIGY